MWFVLQIIQASSIPHRKPIVGSESEIEFVIGIADMRSWRRFASDIVADVVVGHGCADVIEDLTGVLAIR